MTASQLTRQWVKVKGSNRLLEVRDCTYFSWGFSPLGAIGTCGQKLKDGVQVVPLDSRADYEEAVQLERMLDTAGPKLQRWARRDGKVVQWRNLVGYMTGQEFLEEFATEAEAIERERQAVANEPIGDRHPVALRREKLR